MIKAISFQKEFIPLIKSGKKTVTRRVKTNLKAENICYFKVGRWGRKEGYLKIKSIFTDRIMGSFCVDEDNPEKYPVEWTQDELDREGNFDIMQDFIDLWDKLNKKGYEWKDNPMVYRIEFEYLGENLNEKQN